MFRQNLPNLLTLLRAIMAGVFFVVLNNYRYHPSHGQDAVLVAAVVIFIVAGITDWADGYLARKWKVVSSFGRIMDPFCDKLLVLGAFIYLSGPRFVNPESVNLPDQFFGMIRGNMVSGIYPWMVALMLARELLVTGIRGELEGRGVKFGAQLSGKLKTILQLVIIPCILAIVWVDPMADGHRWLRYVRDALVYATVLVTVISGVPYILSAKRAMKRKTGGQ